MELSTEYWRNMPGNLVILHAFVNFIIPSICASQTNIKWESWWHYKLKEIGGPDHWGHPSSMPGYWNQWKRCSLGRAQSPISILTDFLIYDKQLPALDIQEVNSVNLELQVVNTGRDVFFNVEQGSVVIRGGPLLYDYEVYRLMLKFGKKSSRGSDHSINNDSYPGEVQIYGYNKVLHTNYTEALSRPYGIVAVSSFFKIDSKSNTDFSALVAASEHAIYKDQRFSLKGMKVEMLLPSTKEYITYEGSLSYPPCHESVTWIILNEPISVTETQMKTLRKLRASKNDWSGVIADNFRPSQDINRRPLRTNIQLSYTERMCQIERDFFYSVNDP